MRTGRSPQLARGGASGAQFPGDLVPTIVQGLQEAGEYRVVLDPLQAQQLVDVRWAALDVERVLGRRVRVVTSRAIETRDAPVTVLVTFGDQHRVIPQQRIRY
jgi:hypothetical protein